MSNMHQHKNRESGGIQQVKRGDRVVRGGTRGSSRDSQVRSQSNDKHEDVYMTKNVMGKHRKKALKTSSISDTRNPDMQQHSKQQSN